MRPIFFLLLLILEVVNIIDGADLCKERSYFELEKGCVRNFHPAFEPSWMVSFRLYPKAISSGEFVFYKKTPFNLRRMDWFSDICFETYYKSKFNQLHNFFLLTLNHLWSLVYTLLLFRICLVTSAVALANWYGWCVNSCDLTRRRD